MKIFTQIAPSTTSRNLFAKIVVALVFMLGLETQAQLFQQQFAGSTTVGDYVSATPNNGQFTQINATSGSAVTATGNRLNFTRTSGGTSNFVRSTSFSPSPAALMVRFDITVSGNSTASSPQGTLYLGTTTGANGFANDNNAPSNANSHSRIGISWTSTAGQFSVRRLTGTAANGNNYTGTQTVLWVVNNSGNTLNYVGPNGIQQTIANDKNDLWVGTTLEFDEFDAQTSAITAIDKIKFVASSQNGTISVDNVLIDPIPAVPTSSAATSIGSDGFTANWSTVSGVTGYRIDVATDATFTNIVPAYNNYYVTGQATNSLAVTGLNASTTYYYRVRGASQYAVGEFAGGNSGSQNLTTTSSFTITYANLQHPTANQSINEGSSLSYYGRVFANGVTNSPGEGTLLDAWIGYSATNNDPSGGSWTWVSANYFGDDGVNNDEYLGTLSGLTPGTYYVAYRYRVSTGSYVYGGKNNAIWASTSDNAQLTVNSLLVDWCNLQYPVSGSITQDGNFNVYAKVYLGGVTNTASPGAGISGWIGYSTSNTNPNTWTNWVPATFSSDAGNDDEYVANIGTSLTPGTYYYASRFQRTGSTEYKYGDINGVWDNTTENGQLTVLPPAPVVTAASPTGTYNASFNYQIVASNSPTSYTLSSGTLPTGLSLNTTSGVISGTPTQVGTFNVDFTATNAGGTSDSAVISIIINQASQTITFGALNAVTYGVAPYSLTGTASSGLTVSYASSNEAVATVSGNTITIVGAGSTTITASQAGDTNYTAATNVPQTLTVTVKNLTISNVFANDKVQDGTTTATLYGSPSLNGIVPGDEPNVALAVAEVANFATAAPGTGIAVTVTGYTLTGSRASNYSVTQPTGLTANITALTAPVATEETDVMHNAFKANWNAVTGASAYLLDVYTKASFEQVLLDATFEDLNGTGGNDGVWSGNIGTGSLATYTAAGWTFAVSGAANKCIKSGTGAAAANVTTPAISGLSGNAVVTFRAAGFGTDNTVLTVGVTGGGAVSGTNSFNLVNSAFSSYTVNITGGTASTKLSFTSAGGGKRLFIDDIKVTVAGISEPSIPNSPFTVNAPATSYDVTGLSPATNYYYKVKAVNGSFTTASSNEISAPTRPAPVTWTVTGWSNTDGPTSAHDAIIEAPFNTEEHGTFTAYSLTLTSGSFTINSGDNITVVNKVVNSLATANFVVENNANLLQGGITNQNSGGITVKRNSAALKRLDYTLWSSPVAGQGLYAFSPSTFANRFYTYNPTNDQYAAVSGFDITGLDANDVNGIDNNNVPFSPATGYLIRMPWNHPTAPTTWSGTFAGTPNNGNVPVNNLTVGRYYAIGNPYPSTIDADLFIGQNNIGDDEENPGDGLYFWRKTNNSTQASYATYTTAGGVKSGGDTLDIVPNGIIQVGQGFIVRATSNALMFRNTQRIDNNENQILKNGNIERHRIWLKLSNATTLVNGMMVAYMTGATQDIDAAIDGRYFNDNATALNSLINNKEFAIQGRSLPFDSSDIVPLAFKTASSGNFTIAIDQVDGLFAAGTQTIYLKDNLTSTLHDLSAAAYTFATNVGTFNNRFELVYQNQLSNPVFTAESVLIFNQNNDFVIHSGNTIMSSVKVFDIRGRLLQERKRINATQTTIDGGLANQVLLVQITSDNGNVVTKKVIK